MKAKTAKSKKSQSAPVQARNAGKAVPKQTGKDTAKAEQTTDAKAPATPPAPTINKKARPSKYSENAAIKLIAKENPKKEGSAARERFALYRNNMKVADYIAAGGRHEDLAWDTRKGFIEVIEK